MTFWKVSDTRMNCLITEAEIAALGYSLEDLTQDRERTEEFLNLLLKKGSLPIPSTKLSNGGDFIANASARPITIQFVMIRPTNTESCLDKP